MRWDVLYRGIGREGRGLLLLWRWEMGWKGGWVDWLVNGISYVTEYLGLARYSIRMDET